MCDSSRRIPKESHEQIRTCDLCNGTFTYKHTLKKHIIEVHDVNRVYKCRYENCKRCFKEEKTLNGHIRSKHENNICPLCGDAVIGKVLFKSHLQQLHPEKFSVCRDCGKIYSTPGFLNRHLQTCRVFYDKNIKFQGSETWQLKSDISVSMIEDKFYY